jgi:hypothetical protein
VASQSLFRLRPLLCSDVVRVILDARVGFEILKGYVITFEFATYDIANRWKKMILPHSAMLEKKVQDMQNEDIGVNFAFRSRPRETPDPPSS